MPLSEQSPIRPNLFTQSFGQDFCDTVVGAALDDAMGDPLRLSQTLILLPNNRTIKAMTEAFVRRAQTGLLMPRMVAVGDLALDEALGPLIDPLTSEEPVPPAIAPMQRLLLLTQLIDAYHRTAAKPVSSPEALRLARLLAEVIDAFEIEEIAFTRFLELDVAAELSSHWQSAYAQLLSLVPAYYGELTKRNLLGPAMRRNQLLGRLSQALLAQPPETMVIAAGISTAAPAIVRLLRRIALLPKAMVILPAIDLAMADEEWEFLRPEKTKESTEPLRDQETHPQFHLKLLLDNMGFQRSELRVLGSEKPVLNAAINAIFCPPLSTGNWRTLPKEQKNLPHIRLMTADDSSEEARAIAILIRQALEQPELRVAVVTPDRELSVRIAAQLLRWNIQVDDSAGVSLTQTPHGTLLMALAVAVADHFSPVSFLAIVKHPLVQAGDGRLPWLEHVRTLDILLRGPNTGIGLEAIGTVIVNNTDLSAWWKQVQDILLPLEIAAKGSFADMVIVMQSTLDTLTEGSFWKKATGRQFAAFFEELLTSDLSALGKGDPASVPALLSELLNRQVLRPAYGGHPRVAIYGLLEARLQSADLVIAAGLNEGTWPQLTQPDPWLAPRIRRVLDMAGLERNIGLSAHDLATAMGAKQILLSRAKRDRSGPTVASRFLLRIQAMLGKGLQTEAVALHYSNRIDAPSQSIKVERPAPAPSLVQRKRTMRVTDFDQLKADPYSYYAGKILRLKSLEAVGADPSYAWRGTQIHDLLDDWAKKDDCDPDKLIARVNALLANKSLHPALRALWLPRITAGLQWLAQETLRMRDDEGRVLIAAEADGETVLDGVRIIGRADRIDRLADGSLAVLDYKSGKPPSNAQVFAGFAMQLGLLALMAESAGIKDVQGTAGVFEYWSLSKRPKGDGFGRIQNPTGDKETLISADQFVAFTREKALEVLQTWITGGACFTAKLHPEYAPYADYDQLMRLQEWDGRQPIEDGTPL
jgi:ATP-dependent helicase/nuclease subunit B